MCRIFRVGSRGGRGAGQPVKSVVLGPPGTARREPTDDAPGKVRLVEGAPAEDALPGWARGNQSLDRSLGSVGSRRPSIAVEERRRPRGQAVGLQPLGGFLRQERQNRHPDSARVDPGKDDLVERRTGNRGAIEEMMELTGTQREWQRDGRGRAGRSTPLGLGQSLPCSPVPSRRNTAQTEELSGS